MQVSNHEKRSWLDSTTRIPNFGLRTVLLIAALSRLPFLFLGHYQEDAFIHFRIARHFWDTGEFAYNAGEPLLATTSPLYVFAISPLFVLPDGIAILLVQLFSSAATIAAIYILVTLFGGDDPHHRSIAFLAVGITPVAIVISTTGMEAPYVLLGLTLVAKAIESNRNQLLAVLLSALLPSIRLDSMSQIVAVSIPDIRRKSFSSLTYLAAGIAGLLIQLAIAKLIFNEYLPQSVKGKATSYAIDELEFSDRLMRVFDSVAQVAMPIDTRFFDQFAVVWVVIGVIATAFAIKYGNFSSRLKMSSVGIIWGVPAIYAVSGTQIFPWYIWPSSIWLYAMTAMAVISPKASAPITLQGRFVPTQYAMVLTAIVIAVLYAGQIITSYTNGVEEWKYRRGIGEWIRENSSAEDGLMLVPIGIIGFESQKYVHDEIALISPIVEQYRHDFGMAWWTQYLKDYSPELLLQTDRILKGRSPSAILDEAELQYFNDNYELVRRFEYDPSDFSSNSFSEQLLSLGSADSYNLYRRK